MNFSSHQERLLQQFEATLAKPKLALIDGFRPALNSASQLFKTSYFDFWLRMLDEVHPREIPMTKFGYSEAKSTILGLRSQDRNEVVRGLACACERLLTYSNINTDCDMQSTYHFYFNIREACVYKVSELGLVSGCEPEDNKDSRIAKLSEVSTEPDELYA
jgi:hypothetical protein